MGELCLINQENARAPHALHDLRLTKYLFLKFFIFFFGSVGQITKISKWETICLQTSTESLARTPPPFSPFCELKKSLIPLLPTPQNDCFWNLYDFIYFTIHEGECLVTLFKVYLSPSTLWYRLMVCFDLYSGARLCHSWFNPLNYWRIHSPGCGCSCYERSQTVVWMEFSVHLVGFLSVRLISASPARLCSLLYRNAQAVSQVDALCALAWITNRNAYGSHILQHGRLSVNLCFFILVIQIDLEL